MAELALTLFRGKTSLLDLFVYPYFTNQPEVYTFGRKRKVFVLESGAGGIMGHSHKLTRIKKDRIPTKIRGAELYFTMEKEYLHSHPDDTKIYYIIGHDIYDYDTQKIVTSSKFGAGHFHGLKVREVYELTRVNKV